MSGLIASLAVAAVSQPEPTRVSDLAWLAGCWEGSDETRQVSEQWMKPAGNTMLGSSRTVADGRTVQYEFMILREKNREVFYVARPSGQEQVQFRLASSTPVEAIFENPEHDFPKRIIYQLRPDGTLRTTIEGNVGDSSQRAVTTMRRAKCE